MYVPELYQASESPKVQISFLLVILISLVLLTIF